MKKIDTSVVVEVVGATSVTVGLAIVSVPLALVVLGVFLIWVTEKAN
jgi:hypothetical protein